MHFVTTFGLSHSSLVVVSVQLKELLVVAMLVVAVGLWSAYTASAGVAGLVGFETVMLVGTIAEVTIVGTVAAAVSFASALVVESAVAIVDDC